MAEAADEGFAEETVDGDVEFAPSLVGSIANSPTVEVEADEPALEMLLADGIEGAGDGFHEARTAFAARFLQGAEAAALGQFGDVVGRIVVVGEGAVLAVDDGCDEFAFGVGVGHALTVDDGLR